MSAQLDAMVEAGGAPSARQPRSHCSRVRRAKLQRVLARMEAESDRHLPIASLARESGYSRAHFLRMFRAATGTTPHRFLLELRLEKARALVTAGNLGLSEIAATCGFSSHAHLSTAFRARFGKPPDLYRRRLRP